MHGALLTVSLLFGAHYVTTKLVIDAVPPRAWVCFRIAITTLLLLPLVWRFGRGTRPTLRMLPWLALASLLGIVLNQVLFTEGLERTTPAHSSVINAGIPIWTLCIAVLCGQERMTRRKAIAVGTALAGVAVLLRVEEVFADVATMTSRQLIGDLLTVINGISFSAHLVLMRRIGKQIDPWLATGVMFLFATAMVPVYGGDALNGDNWQRFATHPTVWFGLYPILFATVLTYVLNTWALRHAHSSQVALYINVQPLVAAALAPLVGMAGPDWRFFVALTAVSIALLLQARPRRSASDRNQATDPGSTQ